MHSESASSKDILASEILRAGGLSEDASLSGHYAVECIGADGLVKWTDTIKNAVTQEGKVCALNQAFKSSAFTQASYIGLISATGYTTPPANTNTAANISTTAATNGWQEVISAVVAARGTPSWGTSTGSGGNASLACTAIAFSILGTLTIKGCFLVLKNLAGTGASATVGDTTGALYSAGLFTGGDKAVGAGDTLNVTYTGSLT
jgi:hypothetical protein